MLTSLHTTGIPTHVPVALDLPAAKGLKLQAYTRVAGIATMSSVSPCMWTDSPCTLQGNQNWPSRVWYLDSPRDTTLEPWQQVCGIPCRQRLEETQHWKNCCCDILWNRYKTGVIPTLRNRPLRSQRPRPNSHQPPLLHVASHCPPKVLRRGWSVPPTAWSITTRGSQH